MSESAQATVTRLLGELQDGSRDALDLLFSVVYDELLVIAHRQRQRWRGDYTVGTTALVHEAYLKLVEQDGVDARNRAHFFALASKAMRHILCNYARGRRTHKRGGGLERVTLSDDDVAQPTAAFADDDAERLLALDAALRHLEQLDDRRAKVVECRFFGGMTVEDTAQALGVSPRTVKRDWAAAQEWLYREINEQLENIADRLLPPLLNAFFEQAPIDLEPGQRIGQYEIVGALDSGGMGMIFKACDPRLDRLVALKFLPPHLAAGANARTRLIHEARAASALDHPNICTVYDVGELDDGRLFIALAYYDGETLRNKILRGPLPPSEMLTVARQIADGLSVAHRRGIIHRDIKPSNVIVTHDGLAKILDFGIATTPDVERKTEAISFGTVAYMSPEQTRGEQLGAHTDVWSFGVLLYEMLTGRRPFRGGSDRELIAAIRHHPPAPIEGPAAAASGAIVRVIDRCLQKDAAARYPSAEDILADLALIDRDGGLTARRVAVLPFPAGTNADDAYFVDGVSNELITRLSSIAGVRVIARGSAAAFATTDKSPQQAGFELDVEHVITGSVQRRAAELQIILRLIDVRSGEDAWAVMQTIALADLQKTMRTLALQIASELDVRVHAQERRQLAKQGTVDAAAYALYLKGRYFINKRDRTSIALARDLFQQALDLDPLFAQAWTGLADSYSLQGSYSALPPEEAYPRARAAAEQALAVDDELAEAHVSLATTLADYYYEWPAARDHYRCALELNPSYSTAHLWYAGYLRDLGHFDDALTHVRIARRLDPLSLPIQAAEGITLYVARRYDESTAVLQKLLEITPGFSYAHFLIALSQVQQQRYMEALASLDKAESWSGAVADVNSLKGHIYARLERQADARRMIASLETPAHQQYASPFQRAVIHVALNETDRALQLLELTCATRSKQARLLGVEPLLDPLRSDERFSGMVEKMGLTRG